MLNMAFVYLRHILLAFWLLASAWSAGFFYTYSISVMPGLTATDSLSAIRAMQGINAVINTPAFAFSFFGALVLPLALASFAWLARQKYVAFVALSGCMIYAIGVVAVTFLINAPLNESLAAARASEGNAGGIWEDYSGPWTLWNHLRALAAGLAFGCSAVTLAAEVFASIPSQRRPPFGTLSASD